jgi:hypothetical protein
LGDVALLHVTVCPVVGVELSQAASAGCSLSRTNTPSADEIASKVRLGTNGGYARRIDPPPRADSVDAHGDCFVA